MSDEHTLNPDQMVKMDVNFIFKEEPPTLPPPEDLALVPRPVLDILVWMFKSSKARVRSPDDSESWEGVVGSVKVDRDGGVEVTLVAPGDEFGGLEQSNLAVESEEAPGVFTAVAELNPDIRSED